MATSIAIEEDSGTGTGRTLAHNGYYAGDFFGLCPCAVFGPSAAEALQRRIGRSRLPAGTLKDAV